MDSCTRLFLAHCGVDVGMACEMFNDVGHAAGNWFMPLPCVAMSCQPDDEAEFRLLQPLHSILQETYDLEERDGFGRTPLLASLDSIQRNQIPEVVHMLLQAGADPLAVDSGGCGILHFIFRTSSACNNASMPTVTFNSFKDLVVRLLRAGCDPSLQDEEGRTPSDTALSPAAWVLWCESVHAAGLEMSKILLRDDELQGVHHRQSTTRHPGYIEEKYQRILLTFPPMWHLDTDFVVRDANEELDVCERCNLPDHWMSSRPPFDTASSYSVKNGGTMYHAFFSNHRDGSFCENVIQWGSCKNPGHIRHGEVTNWSWKELSWRKHVAYKLWSNGIWRNPREAYTWASGLSPAEEIIKSSRTGAIT